uniref:Major sperm protein n=1 Tax=Caenorhabditis japonica TaxID=281687 RepID=A0A8R1IP99_CAEJA
MSAPSNYTLSSNIPKRPAKCRKPDESLLEDRGPNLTTAKANQVLLQFVGSKEPINKKEIIEKHNVAQRNLNDCIRFYVNYGVMKSPVKQQVVFEEDFTYDHENMTKLPEIHKQLWHLDAYEKSIDQAYANLSAELEALKKNKWLYLDPEDVHLKDEDVLVSRCEQAEVKIDAQKVLISNAERVAVCKKWSKEELGIPAEVADVGRRESISVDECRKAVAEKKYVDQKLEEISPGVYRSNSTEHHAKNQTGWMGTKEYSFFELTVQTGNVATMDGKEIISNLGPMKECSFDAGSYRVQRAYNDWHTYHIKVINSSARRIGYGIMTTNMKRLGVDPPRGVLDPKEAVSPSSGPRSGWSRQAVPSRVVPARRYGAQKENLPIEYNP